MRQPNTLVFCIIVALFSCSVWTSVHSTNHYVGSCDSEDITVFFENWTDYLIGCKGIARAETFFTYYGYSVGIPVSVYFRNQMDIDGYGPDRKSLIGYFDPKTMSVFINLTIASIVKNSQQMYFRTKLESRYLFEEYLISLVAHEVAHLFAQHNFNLHSDAGNAPPDTMGHGVHEYIASVVQLSSLSSTFREHILRQYNPEIIIDDEQQITALLFACNPEKFSIMSYRHFYSLNYTQQEILLDQIFSNELNPDAIYEFNL